MPNSIIKSVSKKTGKSIAEVEKLWDKAVKAAAKQMPKDSDQFFAYAAGILKKMASVNEAYDDLNSKHRLRSKPKNDMSKIFKRDQYLRDRDKKDKERKKKMKKTDKKLKSLEESLLLENDFRLHNKEIQYKFSGKWVGGPKAVFLFRKQFNVPAAFSKQDTINMAKKLLK